MFSSGIIHLHIYSMTKKEITNALQEIVEAEKGTIKGYVAHEALDDDDPISFFKDLLNHGCISGMIPGLIYYSDTHKFYDTHYDEIEVIREEYEESTGSPIQIKGDIKNFFAWFAYEYEAYRLAQELELEI